VGDGTTGRPVRGLRAMLRELGTSALGLAHTRLELAALEFDEVRSRTFERMVLIAIAVLGFGFAVLAASALVVVAFWDTYRIAALCGVTLAYLLVGLLALWRLSTRQRAEGAPFAGTLAEFERDRAWLAGQWGEDK
jgi:uncharacterized membrane protein YqjE